MKILVTGARGMLGRYLVGMLSKLPVAGNVGLEVTATDREQLDITHPQNTSRFISDCKPDVIVNCAAFTNVDACETQVSDAFAVNATGAKSIAMAGKEVGAKIVHISTDYVFDGSKMDSYCETDKPNPLSVYGKSKLEGELAIQEIADNYAILRTAWVFGPYRRNFVTAILDRGKKDRKVSVVTDQHGSPTYTADLSQAVWNVISQDVRGLCHFTNTGKCSRYDWAKKIFELTGEQVSVLPMKTADYKRAAVVPQNSALNCAKYMLATGHKIRPWQEALEEYLQKTLSLN
ncbi:MAG TPA: dTDP-4-dehydrorhamnose reductase [Candidatus Brocadiaceae bacterium]|nr:dTDP-4-dehydrorhamnose reductase [Candidatus Brocadiaceae bacterium]